MREPEDIGLDLFRRLDFGGELGEMVRAFDSLLSSSDGRSFLRLLSVDVSEVQSLMGRPEEMVRNASDAIIAFVPVAWAPSSDMPYNAYTNALTLYRRTGDLAAAAALLVEAWNEPNRLRILLRSLIGLGSGYESLNEMFRLRWRLVDKALHHHEAGAYEASAPIILAQIDGIVWDVTEHRIGFFSGTGQGTYLIDQTTVAGLPEGLEALRKLTSRGLKQSGATGNLVRHGILHGQELGYGTRENSTKAFVLLLAVLDWAKPRAAALADRLREEEEAKHAGSDAEDQRGRRLDRRGFSRAQEGLQGLMLRQLNEYGRHR